MISLGTIIIVLVAAVLHATWNAIVKNASDQALSIGLVSLGHFVPAIPIVFYLPMPNAESLPYIAASTVIHWGYYYFLVSAYKQGDLSIVYPIARGTAPVIIASCATIWPGELLPVMAWAGIISISFGVFILLKGKKKFSKALIPALSTAVMVAAYSVVDGIGVRVSKAPLSYIAWLFTAEIFVALFILAPRFSLLRIDGKMPILLGFLGGVLSSLSYALALYAKTVAPFALVAALRETSVIIAAAIGVIWFKEKPVYTRLTAAFIVAFGIILIAQS